MTDQPKKPGRPRKDTSRHERMKRRYQRSCERCVFGRPHGRSMLCQACKATGWRWCSGEKHVVKVNDLKTPTTCKACANHYQRDYQRGYTPPDGWITVHEASTRYHYSINTINNWCRLGKVRAWQAHKRHYWYIDEATLKSI